MSKDVLLIVQGRERVFTLLLLVMSSFDGGILGIVVELRVPIITVVDFACLVPFGSPPLAEYSRWRSHGDAESACGLRSEPALASCVRPLIS